MKLFNIAEVSKLNKEEKMAYDVSLKEKWDYYNAMDYVHKEGVVEGVEIGKVLGVEIGKAEEKLNNARAMKAKGISDKMIADILNLTLEQVDEL